MHHFKTRFLKRGRIVLTILLWVSVLYLGGCAQAPKGPELGQGPYSGASLVTNPIAYTGETLEIGICVASMQSDATQQLVIAMQDYVGSTYDGVTVRLNDCRHDIAAQIIQIENLIASGVDVLIIQPLDMDALVPILSVSEDIGTPVIFLHPEVEDLAYLHSVHFVTGDLDGAKVIAEQYLIAQLKGKGTVLMLEGKPWTYDSMESKSFFPELFSESKIKVHKDDSMLLWDALTASIDIIQDYYAQSGPPDAILCQTPDMAQGAILALEGIEDVSPLIVNIFGTDNILDFISRGDIAATTWEDNYSMALTTVDVAVGLALGNPVDRTYTVPYHLIAKENVTLYLEHEPDTAPESKPSSDIEASSTISSNGNEPYFNSEVGSDKVIKISSQKKYGLRSKETGEIVAEPIYVLIDNFSEGLAVAATEDGIVYLDEDGQVVIELGEEIDYANDFQDGLAKIGSCEVNPEVTKNNTRTYHNMGGAYYFGYIDKTGKIIMPVQYLDYSGDLFRDDKELSQKYSSSRQPWNDRGTQLVQDASRDYLWGVIDRQGNYVVEPIYDWVNSFHEGLAITVKNGKYGFVNEYGEVVIDFLFSNVHDFSNGLAAVAVEGKFGHINKEGKWVIQPKYDAAFNFNEDGYAVVMPTALSVSEYENVKTASELDFGYYDKDYYIYNYLILNKQGEIVFEARQLFKSKSWPDTRLLVEGYLRNPNQSTASYPGTPYRQTFENQVVSKMLTGEICNAKDSDSGHLEITYEYSPLDVIDGDAK